MHPAPAATFYRVHGHPCNAPRTARCRYQFLMWRPLIQCSVVRSRTPWRARSTAISDISRSHNRFRSTAIASGRGTVKHYVKSKELDSALWIPIAVLEISLLAARCVVRNPLRRTHPTLKGTATRSDNTHRRALAFATGAHNCWAWGTPLLDSVAS